MRCIDDITTHFSIIGMATVINSVPLYYEATNEKGLSIAGLNFPDNAHYNDKKDGVNNITPFEFIPYVLSRCENVDDASVILKNINLVNISFSEELPLSPLHFFICDSKKAITVEPLKTGLKIYENPVGVLTNNPTFDWHLLNLQNYTALHNGSAENKLIKVFNQHSFSLGLGAVGLPGDFSSPSRFVKAVFVKENSPKNLEADSAVNQFFHILSSVAMPKGCVQTERGEFEYTRYTCCCDTKKGDYYYTTYENPKVTKISIRDFDLNSSEIYSFKLK
jgi:choloylglycine hydrolase